MRFGSLFAGIGGLDLGLEHAGMECIWQVELDDYCTKVLEKHWPDVRRYRNVKEIHGNVAHAKSKRGGSIQRQGRKNETVGTEGNNRIRGKEERGCPSCLEPVDLIAGGFPCQPHSVAGKRKGAADDRNLWPEFIRVIRETRPRYVLAENVPGIITTYLDTVLSDLEGEGYATWPFAFSACGFDAPHRRERIFIVAYRECVGREAGASEGIQPEVGQPERQESKYLCESVSRVGDVADTDRTRASQSEGREQTQRGWFIDSSEATDVANTKNANGQRPSEKEYARGRHPEARGCGISGDRQTHWTVEPNVGRVAHGIPKRVDRLRGLGNAVVPQVAEWIGRRIMEHAIQQVE